MREGMKEDMQKDTQSEHGEMGSLAFSDPSLPLAVVVANTLWDEPPRMRHDVTWQLTRFCNVVFVEYSPSGKRGAAENVWRAVCERILVYTPTDRFRAEPRLRANIPWIHARANRRYANAIRNAVRSLSGVPRLLFNFVYDFPQIMQLSEFDWSCYICVDEFPRMRRRLVKPNALKAIYQGHLFQYYENRVARDAARTFVCHHPLREKLTRAGGRVDYLYHANPYGSVSVPSLRARKDPIQVGYGGHINYRLMCEWLELIAEQGDMILHLIGRFENADLGQLTQHENVRLHTDLSDDDFFGQLRAMDVLVMPYNPEIPEVAVMTTNSKTFQYIAAGRPMVMSDMPNYIDLPEGVTYRAKTAPEFLSAIRKAFRDDSEDLVRLRMGIAAENTWDIRGNMLRQAVEDDLGTSIGG